MGRKNNRSEVTAKQEKRRKHETKGRYEKSRAHEESVSSKERDHGFRRIDDRAPIEDFARYKRDLKQAAFGADLGGKDCIRICDTPASLVMLGASQKPVVLTRKHARQIINRGSEEEHFHGLGLRTMLDVPRMMLSPAMIIDAASTSMRQDAIVMVLAGVDRDRNPLTAIIKPDGRSIHGGRPIDSNHLLTVYGKTNFETFLKRSVAEDRVLFVDERKTEDLQRLSQLRLLRCVKDLPMDSIIHPSRAIGHDAAKLDRTAAEGIEPARYDLRSMARRAHESASEGSHQIDAARKEAR